MLQHLLSWGIELQQKGTKSMPYRREGNTLYIRVDKGQKIVETIRRICQKEHIHGGYFTGIGACCEAVLATWDVEKKEFSTHQLQGMLELVSLLGNISLEKDGTPYIHCHGTFSYVDAAGKLSVAAGHLVDATIGYTGEVVLHVAEKPINRMYDVAAGIDVWDLHV